MAVANSFAQASRAAPRDDSPAPAQARAAALSWRHWSLRSDAAATLSVSRVAIGSVSEAEQILSCPTAQ